MSAEWRIRIRLTATREIARVLLQGHNRAHAGLQGGNKLLFLLLRLGLGQQLLAAKSDPLPKQIDESNRIVTEDQPRFGVGRWRGVHKNRRRVYSDGAYRLEGERDTWKFSIAIVDYTDNQQCRYNPWPAVRGLLRDRAETDQAIDVTRGESELAEDLARVLT